MSLAKYLERRHEQRAARAYRDALRAYRKRQTLVKPPQVREYWLAVTR